MKKALLLLTLLLFPFLAFSEEGGVDSKQELKELNGKMTKMENAKIAQFEANNNKEFATLNAEKKQAQVAMDSYCKSKITNVEPSNKKEYGKAMGALKKTDPEAKKLDADLGAKKLKVQKFLAANDTEYNELFQKKLALDPAFAKRVAAAPTPEAAGKTKPKKPAKAKESAK